MARGLDHIVHAVRDLDAAAGLYRRLGFKVGSRNRHPRAWGTQNHIVQLPGTFIELLTVADPTGIAPHAPQFFSFGAFNRDFLARGEGLAMLVLEGRGAPDAAEFRRGRHRRFRALRVRARGKAPRRHADQGGVCARLCGGPGRPDTGFFTCQHRYPESFWNPAFQRHPNTASAVAGVVLVAENPSDHHIFLEAFTGEREAQATSAGIGIRTPRGRIQVMEPDAFRERFGTDPPATGRGARLAALRFAVRDLEAVGRSLRAENLASFSRMGHIVVGPDTAMGATLVFEQI